MHNIGTADRKPDGRLVPDGGYLVQFTLFNENNIPLIDLNLPAFDFPLPSSFDYIPPLIPISMVVQPVTLPR